MKVMGNPSFLRFKPHARGEVNLFLTSWMITPARSDERV